jgi:phosphatidylinositol 3-kinase
MSNNNSNKEDMSDNNKVEEDNPHYRSRSVSSDEHFYIIDDTFSMLEERRRHHWVRDDISDKCLGCEKTFGIFRRRHHCRSCGGLYCYECSGYNIEIPKFIESCPKPELNPYDIKNYIPDIIKNKTLETLGYSLTEDRVCLFCHRKIKNIQEISDLIKIFSKVLLDIPTYMKLALVSKSWNKIAKFYLNNFKQIQFYLPDHKYSEREKQLLWINRKYLSGHSKWLIPLVKSINWKQISVYDKKEVIDLLYKQRTIACKSLMCVGNCNHQLTPEDAIVCLYPYIEEKEIRKYIFESLSRSPIMELLSYLPYMVYTCRFYYNKVKNKCQMSDYLIHISSQNYIFLNYFYWELNLQMCDREFRPMYHNIKLKLLDKMNSQENREILLNSEGFFKNLATIIEKQPNPVALKDIIRDHLLFKNYFANYPISLPLQPTKLCIGIDLDALEIKDSATKPLLIAFNCIRRDEEYTNYTYSALYKREDLRKDYIVSKIILLMDLIIFRELGIELNLINYAILPIDEKSGFVEIVQNAHTIYNIHEKKKFTIQNFIIEYNGNIPMEVLRDRFVKSCAGYCVISYLLGIGDRHLDNIMITEDGYLFHIDYSFILGYDPKIITKNAFGGSEIRLTSDMIDMMGGMESKHYIKFKELCNQCYNCLRQHSNLFYILLNMLHYYKPDIDGGMCFTRKIIEKHIIEKFIPFESNYEAKIHINTKISHTTHQSLGTSISDFFHYYNKEGWIGNFFKSV